MGVRELLNRLLGRPAVDEGEAELGGRIEVVKAAPSWLEEPRTFKEEPPSERPPAAPPSAE